MSHVVLLGDSIFDNRVYVSPEPDVPHQLQARLGGRWNVTLLAVDGHVTADVTRRQLQRVPKGASHLVISVGGNDALGHSSILGERAGSVAEAVERLRARQGHSVAVLLDWPSVEPPDRLYHGTVERNLDAILTQGLRPMRRHHVHLSPNAETARRVGRDAVRP